ncbi:MAG TPA: hypothetical protein VJW23_17925 [Propionibacteriaceae bacterium]|nr:hypothetical protein [Propionibacteriaceae bacterium]
MSPFSVTLQNVPDQELGPLLIQLGQAGFHNPIIEAAGADRTSGRTDVTATERTSDLPEDWRLLREREGQSYQWPGTREHYSRYRVFIGTTRAEGAVHIGLGETLRENKWGRDRKYVVAFLSSGSPHQPLAEFVAADDYEETCELVAVIRGSDGGRRMYGAGDALPRVYEERFRTQLYSDRVVYPGVWNKAVVVAHEDDDEAMLNHALIQGRRRYRR